MVGCGWYCGCGGTAGAKLTFGCGTLCTTGCVTVTTGAAGGGLVLDVMGAPAVFVAGAIPLLLAVLLIATKVRTKPS